MGDVIPISRAVGEGHTLHPLTGEAWDDDWKPNENVMCILGRIHSSFLFPDRVITRRMRLKWKLQDLRIRMTPHFHFGPCEE